MGTGPLLSAASVSLALAHCTIPIAVGSLIYLSVGHESLRVFEWVEAVGLERPVAALRSAADSTAPQLLAELRKSVPDGLWVYSSTYFFGWLWQGNHRGWPWVLATVVLAVGSEFGQLFGIVPGYFDPIDICAYIFGFGFGILMSRFLETRHKGD